MAAPAIEAFSVYWKLYGGFRGLAKSPYLYLAALLTFALSPFWNSENAADASWVRPWSQVAIDVVPSMLGFTMGGMAIMLAFSNAKIFRAIAQEGKPNSAFMRVLAAFFHFVLLQTLAIFFALASKAYSSDVISAIGAFVFFYSILAGVAVAGQLLQTARIFNAVASLMKDDDD